MNKKTMKVYEATDLKAKFCLLMTLLKDTKFIERNILSKISAVFHLARKGYKGLVGSLYLNFNGLDFVVNSNGGLGIVSEKCFEPIVFEHIKSKTGDLFIDIGANVGAYSLLASKSFRKVISVEPGISQREILQINIQSNAISNITVKEVAIGSFNGTSKLYKADSTINDSLKRISNTFQTVNIITLDNLLERIDMVDLIKIDVEGSELDVIKSGKNSLRKVREIILESRKEFESQIVEIMKELNFNCYILEDRPKIFEKNLLFSVYTYNYKAL